MRRIHRSELPIRVQTYLTRKQDGVGEQNIEGIWKAARQTKAIAAVFQALQRMSGACERCMYCMDSHGSDIEHFWPKKPYPGRVFLWANMLLCCTECGRFKGSQFPLSDAGYPLLVDPSAEDPWEFLDFDPDTGNLTARYDAFDGAVSPKGEATVRILQLDRREGMAEGYRRTYRRIVARVRLALDDAVIDARQLMDALRELDDHGLVDWCFGPVGSRLQPFEELRRRQDFG